MPAPGHYDLISVITVVSGLLTLLGVIAGLAGLRWTYQQLQRTRTAAEASARAIEATMRQVRRSYTRLLVSTAKRQIAEAKQAADNGDWRVAALRSSDLAEQISQLAQTFEPEESDWPGFSAGFRKWEMESRRAQQSAGVPDDVLQKWERFVIRVGLALDRADEPLGTVSG